jgi:hypothetical protein
MHGTVTTFRRRGQQASTPTPRIRPIISGRGLSHRKSKWERAEIGLDVVAGDTDLELSWRQLASIVGCSIRTLELARQCRNRPRVTRHNGPGR